MSLPQFTTAQINAVIIAQLEASLSTTIPILPKAFSRVLSKVLAGVFVLLYKYSGFIFLQMFVEFASFAEVTINGTAVNPLLAWGRLIGVPDPEPATRAVLNIVVNVENQSGNPVSPGRQLIHTETGVLYETIDEIATTGVNDFIQVRAASDPLGNQGAGVIGNRVGGDELQFVDPLTDLIRVAYVIDVATAGEEGETESAYRTRVVTRFRRRPQGGAYADYQIWALEVDGIIAAYPYTSDDPGVVEVYCEASSGVAIDSDGTPSAGLLTSVLENINLDVSGKATRRPVNAAVDTLPITKKTINATVIGLSNVDDAAATQAQIEAAFGEYFASLEPWIEGLSIRPVRNRAEAASLSGVASDIARANGGFVIDVTIDDGIEFASYALGKGEKAKLGTVTFTEST